MNISKNVRSEDFKAGWVCSIITENRSTDSEPKRGIFFLKEICYIELFSHQLSWRASNRENRREFQTDKRFITLFIQIPVSCCDVFIKLSPFFFGFSLSLASALR